MLLDKYLKLGYTVYAQGDADGRPGDIFAGLVDAGQLKLENTFTFDRDFESAIPISLLVLALRRSGAELAFKPTDLRDAAQLHGGSINVVLQIALASIPSR